MNRASLALGLLLGTVAAALVAAGVARDLERAELRPSTSSIGLAAAKPKPSGALASVGTQPVTISYFSLSRAISTEPTTFIPPSSVRLQVDRNAWFKHYVTLPKLVPQVKQPLSLRAVLDYEFARTLGNLPADANLPIEKLIRDSDGIVEPSERSAVPYGHVKVEGRIVAIAHRGGAEASNPAWTGWLHYDSGLREMGRAADLTAGLIAQKFQPTPWETPKVWSRDRELAVEKSTQFLRAGGLQVVGLVKQIGVVVDLGTWAHGQIDDGLEKVALHMKRRAWLAAIPAPRSAPAVQSAQREKAGKG